MDSRSEIAISVLAHELELANHRIEEDENFLRNYAALAPFARPDELPPFKRFRRHAKPEPPTMPPRGIPLPRGSFRVMD